MSSQEVKTSLLKEFRAWLIEAGCYDEDEVKEILDKDWDGCAYPEGLLGEDVLIDISNFLYHMAFFAAREKVYGDEYWKSDRIDITIVPNPSYEDRSYVYVLDMKGMRVLAIGCGCKTWNHDPQTIEEDLRNLVEQLEKSKIEACPVCGKTPKVEYICPEHGQMA